MKKTYSLAFDDRELTCLLCGHKSWNSVQVHSRHCSNCNTTHSSIEDEEAAKTNFNESKGLILLCGGKVLDILNPDFTDYTVEQIAQALSKLCRFGGNIDNLDFYSVAEHSVLISVGLELLGFPQFARVGLFHDAPEAILIDLPRPIKHLPEMAIYKQIETGIHIPLMKHLNVPFELPEVVKDMDHCIPAFEAQFLFKDTSMFDSDFKEFTHIFEQLNVQGLYPKDAKNLFLTRYEDLNERGL